MKTSMCPSIILGESEFCGHNGRTYSMCQVVNPFETDFVVDAWKIRFK